MDIIALLKEKGLTKSELAERLGIHNQNVNKMLANPTEATIKKIASALGVPIWQLFATKDEICAGDDFFAVVKRGSDVRMFKSATDLKDFCDSL